MTLKEKKIEMIRKNIPMIHFGTTLEKSPDETSVWLYHFMEDLMNDVERIDRQEAIATRNKANAGYTKGNH